MILAESDGNCGTFTIFSIFVFINKGRMYYETIYFYEIYLWIQFKPSYKIKSQMYRAQCTLHMDKYNTRIDPLCNDYEVKNWVNRFQ